MRKTGGIGPALVLGALVLSGTIAASRASFACVTAADCDDGNPCTDDLCDTTGCFYSQISTACDDGNACSTSDVCNGGTCVGGAIATGCTSCQAIATLPAGGGTFVGVTSGTGTMTASCGSTGPSPERVYRWTPSTSGTAVIQTCGNGTLYDSVLHVHNGTCGGAELACNDDTAGCTTGEPNDHHGSRVALAVTAGQTYVIAVDGYNGAHGQYTLSVTAPTVCGNGVREGLEECDGADAANCATGQCTSTCTCVQPAGGLPDLVPQIVDVSVEFNASVASGDVAEGCAEATTGIDLLHFGAYSRNLGTADFVLGDPQCPLPCDQHPLEVCADPEFICSPAAGHNHPHYQNYARYELLDATGQALVVGHKQGYCLRDTECATPVYTCTNQGITAGCADLYGANLGCQYLDITGVPSGTYTLRVTIDPFGRIAELSETNNVVQQPVTITRTGPTSTAPTRTSTPNATPTRTHTPAASATPAETATPGASGAITPSATPTPASTPIPGCAIAGIVPAGGGTVTGITSGVSLQTGTCGSTGNSPDVVYQWTPRTSGTATIQTCGTTTHFDTVVYVRGDACNGTTLACNDDTAGCTTGEPNDHHGSQISLAVTAGRTYLIVVDGYNGAAGTYALTVTAPGVPTATPVPAGTPTRTPTPAATATNSACAAAVDVPTDGGVFTGTTSGASTLAESCASTNASPEQVFRWTPSRSGTAVIETCGTATAFDTVIAVRQPSCASGPERACNDDTTGCNTGEPNDHHGSRVSVRVTAGTSYFIVVDGYGGAHGTFQLRVTPP